MSVNIVMITFSLYRNVFCTYYNLSYSFSFHLLLFWCASITVSFMSYLWLLSLSPQYELHKLLLMLCKGMNVITNFLCFDSFSVLHIEYYFILFHSLFKALKLLLWDKMALGKVVLLNFSTDLYRYICSYFISLNFWYYFFYL